MGHMQAGLFDGFQVKFISNQSCPLEKLMVLRSRGVLPLDEQLGLDSGPTRSHLKDNHLPVNWCHLLGGKSHRN